MDWLNRVTLIGTVWEKPRMHKAGRDQWYAAFAVATPTQWENEAWWQNKDWWENRNWWENRCWNEEKPRKDKWEARWEERGRDWQAQNWKENEWQNGQWWNNQWHMVLVFNPELAKNAEKMNKGDWVFIDGQINYSKWRWNEGQDSVEAQVIIPENRGTLVWMNNPQTWKEWERQWETAQARRKKVA